MKIIRRVVSLTLVLLLVLAQGGVAAKAKSKVSKVALSAVSRTLGFDVNNSRFTLSVKKVTYSNGKTHSKYGYPAGLRFVCGDRRVTLLPLEGNVPGVVVAANDQRLTGSVTVSAKIGSRTYAKCKVKLARVIKATGAAFSPKELALSVGQTHQVQLTLKPKSASAGDPASGLIAWTSSNSEIAAVDERGMITALRAGSATVTARLLDGSKQRASLTVNVSASVSAGVVERIVCNDLLTFEGKVLNTDYDIYPASADLGDISADVVDRTIASTDAQGTFVVGVKPGRTQLKLTSKSSGQSWLIPLEVKPTPTSSDEVYDPNMEALMLYYSVPYHPGDTYQPTGTGNEKVFFYGIGNPSLDDTGYATSGSSITDLEEMRRLFERASFNGGKVAICTRTSMSAADVINMLRAMARNTDITEDSTTYFFYSGHGAPVWWYRYFRGALCSEDNHAISIWTLQKYLDRIPGKVIVIIDCCLSGQYIESPPRQSAGARAFSQQLIDAFSKGASALSGKALTDSRVSAKYKIITSCQPMEDSYGQEFGLDSAEVGFHFFTRVLQQGLDGARMPADANGNGEVTLHELYTYIDPRLTQLQQQYELPDEMQQHAMVWPENDQTVVYARN